jgi:alkylation response protein AidB-like acyl-CoA dehydrogenase
VIDLRDTEQEAEFRTRLRGWLKEHKPADAMPAEPDARHAFLHRWHRQLHEGGWLGLTWPVEHGGQGRGPVEAAIFNEELGRASAPAAPPLLGVIGGAIVHFGTAAQCARYLPPLLAGQELWCAGFSEPGAGSDLAGARTRAERDGSIFRVTGQKIWTSYAAQSDYCLALVRTGEHRHRDLTMLMIDLRTPGITIRPIRQADEGRDFNEVFFDAVEVPADNVIGSIGGGWRIAMETLAYDRGPVDIGFQATYETYLQQLSNELGENPSRENRMRLAEAAIEVEVLRLCTLRSLTARASGAVPGPEGSVDKLLMARTEQRLLTTALALTGPLALQRDAGHGEWFRRYLYSRAATIYGGTAQIQRGIIATNILGLPSGP